MSTIAVTGGNGTLGRAVLQHLAEHDYHTVNVSRGSRREAISDAYIRADLTEPDAVHGAIREATPDAIVHLGMLPSPESNPGHDVFLSNAYSPFLVLDAAEAAGVDRVVLASSLCAIGAGFEPEPNIPEYLPLDEAHPRRPSTSYGIGKQALEDVGAGFGRREDPPGGIVSLRFPWVTDETAIQETFVEPDRTLHGLRESGALWPARQSYFTYIHEADAVHAVQRALEADLAGYETVFLNAADTNAETPTAELVEECYPDSDRRTTLSGYGSLVDTSKAERLLDWTPTRSWRDSC